jgi:hypothetical protein
MPERKPEHKYIFTFKPPTASNTSFDKTFKENHAEEPYRTVKCFYCFGSGFIVSGSSTLDEYLSGSGSGSRVLVTKNCKNVQLKNCCYIFSSNIPKGHPSHGRSLQPKKENIQHFEK